MNAKAGFLALFLTVFTLGLIGGVAKAAMTITQSKQLAATQAPQVAEVSYQAPTVSQPTDIPATQPAPIQAVISSDQAVQLAQVAAGDGENPIPEPELVMFNNEESYEVKFDDGNTIYIGALDGSLKFNSITNSDKPVISADQALILAADYINYYQPVSIAWKDYQGTLTYYIRFWNGANVNVDRAGNILAVQYVQYTSSGNSGSSSSGSTSGSSSSSSGSGSGSESEHESEND